MFNRVDTGADRYSYRRDSVEVSRETPYASAFVSYRPDRKSTWRLEVDNVFSRRFESRRRVHVGQRDITPASFIETRRNDSVPSLRLTYRRVTE